MRLHLTEQVKTYGPQTLVNLVKQKGRERAIKEAFESRLEEVKLADVKYEYFDFAKECSKMKWDRISLLLDRLEGPLEKGRSVFIVYY